MKDRIRKIIKNKITKLRIKQQYKTEIKKMKKEIKFGNLIDLTDEQKKMIDILWTKHYGKKINKNWHRYYSYISSKFNVDYFPEILFTTNLIDKFNPHKIRNVISDKILTYSLFNNVEYNKFRLPKFYFYNCDGYYYSEKSLISKEDALAIIYDIGEIIIKPTVDTNSGKNVKLLNVVNGIDQYSGKKIEDIVKSYEKNYIIQERIKPDKSFSRLNPSSINTIRVNTYVCDSKVYASPTAMRIGRNGNICDNGHAGGIQVGVKDGKLMEFAATEYGEKFDKHPDTGIIFKDYVIPRVNEIVEFAIKYHHKIPHMGCIAWDFTVDQDGYIVLIETNMCCPSLWFPQYTTGESFFGDNTITMIENLNKNNIK